MLDNWEKTRDLLASLKAAAPFEVELTPPLLERVRAASPAVDQARQVVRDVSYAGDEGASSATSNPTAPRRRWSSPSLTSTCAARFPSPPSAKLPEAPHEEAEEAKRAQVINVPRSDGT
jgi:hypothetical protein